MSTPAQDISNHGYKSLENYFSISHLPKTNDLPALDSIKMNVSRTTLEIIWLI